MREGIGLLLAAGMLACSGATTGSTGTGSATAATGTSTGGDSGDQGDGGSDASSSGTSGGVLVTATPLGQICDNLHLCHDSQICVSAGGTATFCTIQCGVTAGSAKSPPDGGNQLCAEANTYGGTGACDLTLKNKNGTLTWDCGLECGKNYGTCPTGLSCSSKNLCQ